MSSPTLGNWGTCSATCGGGTQTRTCTTANGSQTRTRSVICEKTEGGSTSTVADSYCTSNVGAKPTTSENQSCTASCNGYSTSQSCNTQSCITYSWQTGTRGSYGACSVTCGGGTQTRTRTVQCKGSDNSVVSDSYCGGGKPSTSESTSCNTQACPTYTYDWYAGSYGSCSSVSCTSRGSRGTCSGACGGGAGTQTRSCTAGAGTQTRTVYCRRNDGTQVSDSYCSGTKPSSSTSCSSNPGGTQSQSCTNNQVCESSLSCTTQNIFVSGHGFGVPALSNGETIRLYGNPLEGFSNGTFRNTALFTCTNGIVTGRDYDLDVVCDPGYHQNGYTCISDCTDEVTSDLYANICGPGAFHTALQRTSTPKVNNSGCYKSPAGYYSPQGIAVECPTGKTSPVGAVHCYECI